MKGDQIEFDAAAIGTWLTDSEVFLVEQESVCRYVAAVGGEPDSDRTGDQSARKVPRIYSMIPPYQVIQDAANATAPAYGEYRGLHGEHRVQVFGDLRIGDRVRTRARSIGVRQRGANVILQLATEASVSNQLQSRQILTIVFPGAKALQEQGEVELLEAAPLPDAESQALIDTELIAGYADPAEYAVASGDHGRYHLDESFAKTLGLPGRIMHGLHVLGLAVQRLETVMGSGDVTLREAAVRFTAPVRLAEPLAVTWWPMNDADLPGETSSVAFEALASESKASRMSRGRVVFEPMVG